MGFKYEKQGVQSYYVYTFEKNETIDTMSLGMITNNHIDGFLPAMFTQMDEERQIKYNITSRIALSDFFENEVRKIEVLGVFKSVTGAIMTAEEYMLAPESLQLDLDSIFVDPATNEAELVCLPVITEINGLKDIEMFFKSIVFTTHFSQSENTDYVAKIITYLNGKQGFSVQQFHKLIKQIMEASVEKKQTDISTSYAKSVPKRVVPQPSVQTQSITPIQPYSFADKKITPKQPGQSHQLRQQPDIQPPHQETGEKMSMVHLLSHFSSENLEIYKAQRAQEKGTESVSKGKEKKAKREKKQKHGKIPEAGFAVPGNGAAAQSGEFKVPNIPEAVQTKSSADHSGASDVERHPAKPVDHSVVNQRQINKTVGSFGETTVLADAQRGETTVLTQDMTEVVPAPHLIRKRNNEAIPVNKPVFRIGKERSYVDYFIGDNTAISRSHANIITREGEFFIVDTNSTNHTFVNGAIIQSNTEVQIVSGTKLRLANEDFDFVLM